MIVVQMMMHRFANRIIRNGRYLRSFHICSSLNSSEENASKHVEDASKFLVTLLKDCKQGSIFAGTGQYFNSNEQDRLLLLNFQEDFLINTPVSIFTTNTLLDCHMNVDNIDLFLNNLKSNSRFPLYTGELDFVNDTPWEYGFTLEPFSIFTSTERILFHFKNLVFTSQNGEIDVVDIESIAHIGLWVSEEPYNERKLFLKLNNGRKVPLISVETNSTQCDLARLMVETEWLMKASALLCVKIGKEKSTDCHLQLSPVLQPINNEWVAMRQKSWLSMIQKHLWDKKT